MTNGLSVRLSLNLLSLSSGSSDRSLFVHIHPPTASTFMCFAVESAMQDPEIHVAAEACAPTGNGARDEDERQHTAGLEGRDVDVNARPSSPLSDPKPSTSGPVTDVQRIEKRMTDRFDALARLLEEQNKLLRALVEKGDEGRRERDEPKEPSTDRVSAKESDIIERRPASRLQKMGKASASREEDLEIERRRALPGDKSGPNRGRLQEMSLSQRKREFAMKTAPGVGAMAAGGKGDGDVSGTASKERREPRPSRHSRTRLAVAAAKREMERGEEQRARDRDVEHDQANSLGAWILFVLLVLLGAVALASGFIAFRQSKNQPSGGEL